MEFCYTCRGRGLLSGCPTCGKFLSTSKVTKPVVTSELLNSEYIPNEYASIEWDCDILKGSHITLSDNKNFLHYCEQLTKIVNIFSKGELPNQSAIIIAPRGMGKQTFAYNCLRKALMNGYSISPIIDNTELKRINVISSDKPYSKYLWKMVTIEELLTNDVLFVTVDSDNYSTSLRTIESIMNKRARLGKTTFAISRYSLSKMSQYDGKGSYTSFVDTTRKNNNKKYPVIITCDERGN